MYKSFDYINPFKYYINIFLNIDLYQMTSHYIYVRSLRIFIEEVDVWQTLNYADKIKNYFH